VKIIEVDEVISLYNDRQLQTVHLADETGTGKLDLWQEYTSSVSAGKSYIRNAMVKVYNGEYTLTTPKNGLVITHIEDLPVVTNPKPPKSLSDAVVIGVRSLQSTTQCIACNKGEVLASEGNSSIGTCSQCSSTVLLSACEQLKSAEVIIKAHTFRYNLSVMGKQLTVLAQIPTEDITEVGLLSAQKFDCDYNDKMVITNISRKT